MHTGAVQGDEGMVTVKVRTGSVSFAAAAPWEAAEVLALVAEPVSIVDHGVRVSRLRLQVAQEKV